MKNVTIIGAGTMGNGIAHVFAQFNFKVSIYDLSENSLESALKTISKNLDRQIKKEKISKQEKQSIIENISTFTDLKESILDADLVIEAATEDEKIKINIFKKLDQECKKNTILATNTSSISITKIANSTNRPDKIIGMHFMNPVPIMKLVEVIRGKETSDNTTKLVMNLSKNLHKTPVEVNDAPGFVANRILMPMINEAVLTLEQNVSGVQEIDTVMILGMSHPMGPLQLADFIGLDICLSILEVMHADFKDKKYAPSKLLKKMVKENNLGVKTGEGFYNYSKGIKDKTVANFFSK